MSNAKVYIVHAVDTEGPLHESLDATFDRIRQRFGVDLEPTRENIDRLRNKELDLGGKEDALSQFVAPAQIDRNLGSWEKIEAMHATFMSSEWRDKMCDSEGSPYVVSWHCMDHVGYANNPRRRSMGFHSIHEHYQQFLRDYDCPRDRLYFHYHPPSISGDAHHMGRGLTLSLLHNEILARRVIDHGWFPVAFRPGGHIESFDLSMWLEAWIPFDLANQNKANDAGRQSLIDSGMVAGKVSVWQGAPSDWRIYHPDLLDFRLEGAMNRWIGRCLNINARHSCLDEAELEQSFRTAQNGEDVLVSVSNHDFRDMVGESEALVEMIRNVAARFPDTKFVWANTVEAFRKVLGMEKRAPLKLSIEITAQAMKVTADGEVWGAQPFLALKTKDGRYLHDNFIASPVPGASEWHYAFDGESISLDALEEIGVAAHDMVGNTTVSVVSAQSPHTPITHVWNDTDWV